MDKLLLNFIDKYKLNCVTDKLVYGSISNYQIALKVNDGNVFRGYIFTKIDVDLSKKLNNYFVENGVLNKNSSYQIYHYGCSFVIKSFSKKKGYKIVEESFIKIIKFLSDCNALDDSYCPICGMKMHEKEFIVLDGIKFYVDLDCKNLIDQKFVKKEAEADEIPNNYKKGLLGALVAGLIGILVWVLVGAIFGLISGWCAALIYWLAGKGFLFAGGKNGKVRVVTSSVVTLLYTIISMLIVYAILAYKIDKSLFDIMFSGDPLMAIFVGDLGIAIVLSLGVIIYSSLQLKKLDE